MSLCSVSTRVLLHESKNVFVSVAESVNARIRLYDYKIIIYWNDGGYYILLYIVSIQTYIYIAG